MYTQCPYCFTIYEPSATQLATGRGQLRCGVCDKVFDGLERLADEPIHLQAAAIPMAAEAPRLGVADLPRQGELFQGPAPEPAFLQNFPGPAYARSGKWWLASAALALLLIAQTVLAQRDQLAADPFWRPWIARFSSALKLPLTPWRAPQDFQLTARDVRPHPSVEKALLITATFRNASPYPLAWPVLELQLLDLNGNRVALRRFRAEEYLGTAPAQTYLAAQQSVSTTLELADPGKQAIAFVFEFR